MSMWIKVSQECFEKLVEAIPQRIKAGHKANARGIIAHHMGNLQFYEGTINANFIYIYIYIHDFLLPSKDALTIPARQCQNTLCVLVCLHATEKYQPSKICTILLRKYKGESELNQKLELGF